MRVRSEADVRAIVDHPELGRAPKFILGGGSNIVFTRDVEALVVKVEVRGMRLVEARDDAFVVEAGAGESWHDLVAWTLANGWPGLENLALIPGTVGAAPVQNIGAYGVELGERFESLTAVDLMTGLVHRRDLKSLSGSTSNELKTFVFGSANKDSDLDVTFDEYHLERRKDA